MTSASSAKPPRASRRRARHSIWCPCTSTAPTETLPRRESAGFARATTTEPAGGRPRYGRAVGESGRRFDVFSMIRWETRRFRVTSSRGLRYRFVFFQKQKLLMTVVQFNETMVGLLQFLDSLIEWSLSNG